MSPGVYGLDANGGYEKGWEGTARLYVSSNGANVVSIN